MVLRCLLTLALTVALVPIARAEANQETDKERITKEVQVLEQKCKAQSCTADEVEKIEQKKSALNSLKETFKFGLGIGFEHYKTPYISEVETVGDSRIVRVPDSQDYKPGLWLETHYVWDGTARKWGRTHSAPGFYVGARLLGGESDVFDAFGLGVMWSFKRTAIGNIPPPGQVAESINIGVGPVWHRTKVLAPGITEGEPLPADFQDPKLDTKDEISWMIMISAGF
jgi:hypothetical protein